MPRGIVIEIIGDETSYLRAAERTISANTKLDTSFAGVGVSAKSAADAQVASAIKSEKALQGNIVALRELSASSTASAAQREKAALLASRAEASLARSQGLSAAALGGTSRGAKEAERDLGKLTRGALAGSGVFSALGRSLAFASSGFIAIAAGATIITESIKAAEELAAAQARTDRQLKTGGKSWDQYGARITATTDKLRKVAGFTDTELLQAFSVLFRATNNVGTSLTFMGVAADAARALQKPLSATSVALGKALGGNLSALRRLGVSIPKNLKGMEALTFVQEKFAGQAAASTTVSQRFTAELQHTSALIGQALLPTFTRIVGELGNWIAKMNDSGRLQRDLNEAVSLAGDVFHTLGDIIHTVDRVTGSFKNTLQLVLAAFAVRKIFAFGTALEGLAAKWGLVGTAATKAGAAQTAALTESGAAAATSGVAARVGMFTAAGQAAAAAVARNKIFLAGLGRGLAVGGGALALGDVFTPPAKQISRFKLAGTGTGGSSYVGPNGDYFIRTPDGKLTDTGIKSVYESVVKITASDRPQPGGSRFQPGAGKPAPKAPVVFKSFTDTITNQLAQARAALTKSTADEVAAAKAEIAFIRREIKAGHLKGASLIQALQAQASALGTIQSAEADAAQRQAEAVQKQAARIEAALDPVKLEIALARATLSGSTPRVIRALKALRDAARKMLDSGKLSADQQLRELQQLISLNQQIKDAATTATAQFQIPARLAFRLARDTALGRSTTKDLLAIRKAILRFIATHRHNLAALTDAYNQLADINQQLGSSAQSLLGTFRQASTRALTAGLDLTQRQREVLRARLSQLGPHGTVPGTGVGAAGFVIGPDGRPIQVHGRGPTISARDSQTVSPARFNRLLRVLERVAERPLRVVVDLDGKIISDSTTRHQQRHKNHNSSQRRGPNAGLAGA